jgi:uncharacterized protein YrrD
MLIDSRKLFGNPLIASDGNIGHVKDLYFDDRTWAVRYVVADTGTWLAGQLVLLSPHAFGRLQQGATALRVNLSRKQIEKSPPIESHQTVSRAHEIDYFRHYGWPAYWTDGEVWGMAGSPAVTPSLEAEVSGRTHVVHRDDKHLRSTREILGYEVHTGEGPAGTVCGLILDDTSWAISEILVDTDRWYLGKEILVSTANVERITYEESRVYVRLSKAEIKQTSAHHLAGEKQATTIFVD